MINPPIPETGPIHVTCKKCGHTADIILPPDKKRHTDRLRCSKCDAHRKDLVIVYLNIPEPS